MPSTSRPTSRGFRLTLLTAFTLLTLILIALPTSAFPADAQPLSGRAANNTTPKRIAIIGAGASGSAAAFFIARAGRVMERRMELEEGNLVGEVVVYEKEGYVGGRSTTIYPGGNTTVKPVELGASIFVGSNLNMIKAANTFNLTLISSDFGNENGIGIWDGSSFLYTSTSPSWTSSPEANARYGSNSLPLTGVARGSVGSVEEFAEKAGLGREYTGRTGEEWASEVVGESERWVGEVMEGSTRANYARDMTDIHALGAGVSMASSGASQVLGGNWKIFKAMLDDSKATVFLNTQVNDIVRLKSTTGSPSFQIKTGKKQCNDDKPFDAVFFAAPWHSSPISKNLQKKFPKPVPAQPYVHLYTTYLTTSALHPAPSFFGLPANATVPSVILTSDLTHRTNPRTSPAPRFLSMQWHGTETYPGSDEYAVKIFSLERLDDEYLRKMLGRKPSWVLRKEWDSYPELKPNTSYAPVELVKGVQYLAGQEAWVSTMETQTVSAREAVARVVDEWWGLGLGECDGDNGSWDWTC
ncbi:hypothetical protein IAT38_002541 [Cryptococcus sp. DSM 104549]